MIARIQNRLKSDDKGFTLIELLVVMIIIGILAAIAIPIFLSQREKAQDSAAKADVSTLGKEIAAWYVDDTTLPVVTQAGGVGTPYSLGTTVIGDASANVLLGDGVEDLGDPDETNWCIDVTNESGDKAVVGYKYSATGGLEEGACAATV